jgi:glucokinase
MMVGGDLSEAGGALFAPLTHQTKTLLRFGRQPRLLRASLGYRSGCLGAALLALGALSAQPRKESGDGG